IRTRLFCMEIENPPPELGVTVDQPPESDDPDACKSDKYNMWKTAGCKQCHAFMDPVGFGLENFDAGGRFRTSEPDRPDCSIDGTGKLEGIGEFQGPKQLGELMMQAGDVDLCVAQQLYRYAVGRYALDDPDMALVGRLV